MVPARDRARLERLCRYALRPPIADDRLQMTESGEVLLALRHRWTDGTTHLLFDPLELLERLAALTPRPRINLVLYYGVLAAHAGWRSRLPSAGQRHASREAEPKAEPPPVADPRNPPPNPTPPTRRGNLLWAELMARSFGFDVLACGRCGGRYRLIALIDRPGIVERILAHLGLATELPTALPARSPPLPFGGAARAVDDDLPAA
jgi:hypothetical protein